MRVCVPPLCLYASCPLFTDSSISRFRLAFLSLSLFLVQLECLLILFFPGKSFFTVVPIQSLSIFPSSSPLLTFCTRKNCFTVLFVFVPKPKILPAIRPGISSKAFNSSSYEFTFDYTMIEVLKPLPFPICFKNSIWGLLLGIFDIYLIILDILSISNITKSNLFRIGFRHFSI